MKDIEPMTLRPYMLLLFSALALLLASPAAADPPKKGGKGPGTRAPTSTSKQAKAPPSKAKAPPSKAKTPPNPSKAKTPGKAKVSPGAGGTRQPDRAPFKRLKVVIPKAKLGPLRSVRVRTKQEAEDRSRSGTVKVSVSSKPKGASVFYGGKLLGTTPFAITATRGSTPLDVVVRRPGYMVLRTRVRRKVSRQYIFRLTPAKIR